jgi:hypothetical protein
MNTKLLTRLAAIALASTALTTISATGASAASAACGASCLTLASQRFGPGFVSAVPPGAAVAGERVILGAAGPYAHEDWQADYLGSASLLARLGVIPLAIGKAWPNDPAYQYVYTPGGLSSDLCLGIAGTIAVNYTPVVLQPCGVSAVTVWITMLNGTSTVYSPLINGTDVRDANPYVLTAGAELFTHELVPFSGPPSPYQMWRTLDGVLP